MSSARTQVLLIKGAISELEPGQQARIAAAADRLRAIVTETGDDGDVALSLVISERAVEMEGS
jgi:hypothetical protein